MSVTCLCRSVVMSLNIFCLSVFVCELTFGQLSVGELSHNATDYYKFSFFPLAIVQWNSLPESVACLQSLDAFKAAVCKLQHSRP